MANMNEEIKEILDRIQYIVDNPTYEDIYYEGVNRCVDKNPNYTALDSKESKLLLNYITNLQEENKELKSQLKGTTHCYDEEEHKKLKEENTTLKAKIRDLKSLGSVIRDFQDYQDYKSRIDKAIKYIEHNKFIKEQVLTVVRDYSLQDFQVRELLEILGGGSNE